MEMHVPATEVQRGQRPPADDATPLAMALARAAASIAAAVSSGAARRVAAPTHALARLVSTTARSSTAAAAASAATSGMRFASTTPVARAPAAAADTEDGDDELPAVLEREIAYEDSQEPAAKVLAGLAADIGKSGFELVGARARVRADRPRAEHRRPTRRRPPARPPSQTRRAARAST